MDELLKKVAEIRGMPASLIERSAQARADKTGSTLKAVLEEWAGEAGEADETADAAPPQAAKTVDPEPANEPTPAEESDAGREAGTSISTDDLVQMAADAKRMPPKLILSSAQARATHAGSTLEAVLAEWAGVDLDDLETATTEAASEPKEPTDDAEPAPAPEEEPTQESGPPVAAAAVATVATAMSMDELLEKVAEAKGMPASLAKRSAEAKAKKSGVSLEAVLAEWAGVDVAAVSSETTTAASEADSEPTPEPTPAETEDSSPDEPKGDSGVEIIEPQETSVDTGSGGSADDVRAPRGGYPRWLAAAFLLIPLLAVTYLMVSPNGPDCGSGGQLLVDPVTGEAINCDGSDYGETAADFFGSGAAIYAQCAACHGANGAGGVGPAFTSGAVLETFPVGECGTQIEWVGVGTAGWPDSTYGANAKPVGGAGLMPGFVSSLSEQQLAEVALFERVQFGGQDLTEAEIDCGLVEASAEG